MIRQLAPDLFVVDGEWFGSPLRRRMTLVRVDGGIVVHSAIRPDDDDWTALDALGPVMAIVVPNAFHASEAHVFKSRYPEARLFVSPAAVHEVERRTKVDHVLPVGWDLAPTLDLLAVEGTRWLSEWVFLHRPSRTLVTTDLVFNVRGPLSPGTRLFFRLNRIHERFGPSRLFRWVFVKDKPAVAAAVSRILDWDFDRVVMSHGEVLESGGRDALRRGFQEIGIL